MPQSLLKQPIVTFIILVFSMSFLTSKAQDIERIDPPYWWVGMQNDTLQLMITGKDLPEKVTLKGKGVKILDQYSASENQYVVLLKLEEKVKPGTIDLKIGAVTKEYTFKERDTSFEPAGLSPSDLIYLITPDRFANGDPTNDQIEGMREMKVDREDHYARHGGDIAGIRQHLDYIHNLGMTALWINPLLENNQSHSSYHGYAITDHYAIDPRYGSMEDFQALVNEGHEKGVKMVMDVVYNHVGNHHFWMEDSNTTFVNRWPTYTRTNYRASTLHDPHVAQADKDLMSKGWFDRHMPDLDQTHPDVALYLIQNSIWWIESAQLDAFRIDTYAYPDQTFMTNLNKALRREYPSLFIFAETWVHGIQVQSWFPEGAPGSKNWDSHLNSVTDFQLAFALLNGLNEKNEWAKGVERIYYTLSGDYLYSNPDHLVTFIDNHDLARIYGHYGEDMNKFKNSLTVLLTTRGIPQIYYGTEILMKETKGHGEIRQDFPGGWPGDSLNKFEATGRTELENDAFAFIQTLANFRKESTAITQGKLIQFVPKDGVYVYFRFSEKEEVMVIINTSDKAVDLKLDRFHERLQHKTNYMDVLTGEKGSIPDVINLGAGSRKVWVIEP